MGRQSNRGNGAKKDPWLLRRDSYLFDSVLASYAGSFNQN